MCSGHYYRGKMYVTGLKPGQYCAECRRIFRTDLNEDNICQDCVWEISYREGKSDDNTDKDQA